MGGPAIVLYAWGAGWKPRQFVATFQLYAIVLNTALLLAKGSPAVGSTEVLICAVGLVLGILCGNLIARRAAPQHAARAVLLIAFIGATATLIRGLFTW